MAKATGPVSLMNLVSKYISPTLPFFKLYAPQDSNVPLDDLLNIGPIGEKQRVHYSEALHALVDGVDWFHRDWAKHADVREPTYFPHVINRSHPCYRDTEFPPTKMETLLRLSMPPIEKKKGELRPIRDGKISLVFYDSDGNLILRKNPENSEESEVAMQQTELYLLGLPVRAKTFGGYLSEVAEYVTGILGDRAEFLGKKLENFAIGNHTRLKAKLSVSAPALGLVPVYLIGRPSQDEVNASRGKLLGHIERIYSPRESEAAVA